MNAYKVIVAGGGPTGLSLSLFLTEQGIPHLLIDRHKTLFKDPRAATFHPPTLEMLEPGDITEKLIQIGIKVRRWHFWNRKKGLVAEFDLEHLSGDTNYPFRLQCEQHKLSGLLHDELANRGLAEVHMGETVTAVSQEKDIVRIKTDKQEYAAQYLVAADGARSIIRKSLDIDFTGFSYSERFLVVTNTYDFEEEKYALSCYVADPDEWCALFKVPGDGPPGVWRVVFPTDPEDKESLLLSFDYAKERLERFLPRQKPYEILHTNLYAVHQRVAETYRSGRILLAGDAAHVNNPLGGMGMNFGIHDAHNLAEKLGRILNDDADEGLLDRYDRQRRNVAVEYLQRMTIDNKKMLEEKNEDIAQERERELRSIAADKLQTRQYLLKTSMFEGLKFARSLD